MAKFAAIQDDVVYNIIEADTLEIATAVSGLVCIEYTDETPLSIGDEYQEKPAKTVK